MLEKVQSRICALQQRISAARSERSRFHNPILGEAGAKRLGLLCWATNHEAVEADKPMAKVTLATIARHTGLSKFAVSRSLSGKDGVSDETRRRVRDVAAQLGYARVNSEPEPLTLG